jgi:predicted RNase H-like HicB family nuclease
VREGTTMRTKVATYTLKIHYDPQYGYEAAVKELPGCFAAGATLEELHESVSEAIGLYLSDDDNTVVATLSEPTGAVIEERKEFQLLCNA